MYSLISGILFSTILNECNNKKYASVKSLNLLTEKASDLEKRIKILESRPLSNTTAQRFRFR